MSYNTQREKVGKQRRPELRLGRIRCAYSFLGRIGESSLSLSHTHTRVYDGDGYKNTNTMCIYWSLGRRCLCIVRRYCALGEYEGEQIFRINTLFFYALLTLSLSLSPSLFIFLSICLSTVARLYPVGRLHLPAHIIAHFILLLCVRCVADFWCTPLVQGLMRQRDCVTLLVIMRAC
jgi:hypothetical protein